MLTGRLKELINRGGEKISPREIDEVLLTHPASQHVDLSGWKVVIGGSALPKGLAKLAMDRGIDIFGGYGMSETGPVMSMAQLKPDMTDLDADAEIVYRTKAGLPIQLVELRIVDEHMQLLIVLLKILC